MEYQMKTKITSHFQVVNVTKTLALSLLLGGCSSSLLSDGGSEPLALLPADDMKQGPGIFSRDKGAFFIIGGDKKEQKTVEEQIDKQNGSVTYYQKPVANMDLNETSKVLDDKIKQLEQDQRELELLKREVDKKIKTQ